MGTVVAAIGNEDRCPRVAGHRSGLDQPLVGVDCRAGRRDDGWRVIEDAGHVLVSQGRQAAAARIGTVGMPSRADASDYVNEMLTNM